MELINRQDAIKALRDTFLGDTYEIDAVACGMIESLPTVDAIPVNWLTNLAKEYEESDNQYFCMDSCVIEDLIKRWKEEEKQNG